MAQCFDMWMEKVVVCILSVCTTRFCIPTSHCMDYSSEDFAKPLYMGAKCFNCGFKFEVSRSFGSLVDPSWAHETTVV